MRLDVYIRHFDCGKSWTTLRNGVNVEISRSLFVETKLQRAQSMV
jgi:hypothetical protein